MKMFLPTIILLAGLAPLSHAQSISQGVAELPPEDFVDVVTGVKTLPPGAVAFRVSSRPKQGKPVNPRPRMVLPAYGATNASAPFSEADLALASSAGLFFGGIFSGVQDFGPDDAARLHAAAMQTDLETAAAFVAYSETLAYLYRKTLNDKVAAACAELDSNVVGMGETNALQVFAKALDAVELFITQFYLDAFVDMDRQLDPLVVVHVRESINDTASNFNVSSTGSLGRLATSSNWNWINGYCGARRKEQELLANENEQ